MATGGRSTGKVPPDNYDGTVRWVYDDNQNSTLTNSWDRLVCRPMAYELRIRGIESSRAPDRKEFFRVARELRSPRQDIEVHFLARGVRWGWRYDRGLSEIAKGATIRLIDVASKDDWIIAARTDSTAWKRLSGNERREVKSKIGKLERQLLEGTWKPIGIIRKSSGTSGKSDDFKQVRFECVRCFRKLGVAAEFTRDGNIIQCMRGFATPDWPRDWIEWVVQNAGQIIKGVEIDS